MRRRSLLRAALSIALLTAIAPAAPVRAGALASPSNASCARSASSSGAATTFYTFNIDAAPQKKKYRAGTTAKINVRVTRPGTGDPTGGDAALPRTTDFPAADTQVSVSITAGMYYMFGIGVTDENGEATVPVKLHKRSPAGWARADVAARSYYNGGGCPDIEEFGFKSYERFFKITR